VESRISGYQRFDDTRQQGLPDRHGDATFTAQIAFRHPPAGPDRDTPRGRGRQRQIDDGAGAMRWLTVATMLRRTKAGTGDIARLGPVRRHMETAAAGTKWAA
jgi:hypothetical protein